MKHIIFVGMGWCKPVLRSVIAAKLNKLPHDLNVLINNSRVIDADKADK